MQLTLSEEAWKERLVEDLFAFKEIPKEEQTLSLVKFAIDHAVSHQEVFIKWFLKNYPEWFFHYAREEGRLFTQRGLDFSSKIRLELLKNVPEMIWYYSAPTEEECLIGTRQTTVAIASERSLSSELQLLILSEEEELLRGDLEEIPIEPLLSEPWKKWYEQLRTQLALNSLNERYGLDKVWEQISDTKTYIPVFANLIQDNPLLLSALDNDQRTYRLCRLALREDQIMRWFSPYHLLEQLEENL